LDGRGFQDGNGARAHPPAQPSLRVAEKKRPIGKTEPGSGQFENVILFSSELILPGG